jgi:hypothetical protein
VKTRASKMVSLDPVTGTRVAMDGTFQVDPVVQLASSVDLADRASPQVHW